MLAKAIARDEDTFAPALTGQNAATVEAFLERRGFPKEMAHHLQLWFLAVAASLPACEMARAQQGPARSRPDDRPARARNAASPSWRWNRRGSSWTRSPPRRRLYSATLLVATVRAPQLEDDAYATLLRLYREGGRPKCSPSATSCRG